MQEDSDRNIVGANHIKLLTMQQKLQTFNDYSSRYLPKLNVSSIWVEKNVYVPNHKASTTVNKHMHEVKERTSSETKIIIINSFYQILYNF